MSCPALGPRVIDRPRDSGSGGFAPSSPAQPRLRAAPLRSSPWALSARWLFFFCRKEKNLCLGISFIPRGEGFFGFFCRLRRWGGRHPAPTRVPLRVCGTQAPASEMGTGNSASHLRVCRTNLDGWVGRNMSKHNGRLAYCPGTCRSPELERSPPCDRRFAP